MSERPILFSGPMVRAILAGTKTQTRRVVKLLEGFEPSGSTMHWPHAQKRAGVTVPLKCPYGQPGDRLWVRETWAPVFKRVPHSNGCLYRADDDGRQINPGSMDGKWKPSIHMPRWASRITLEITGVRVERLQDISEDDAKAEGVEPYRHGWRNYLDRAKDALPQATAADSFCTLWESLNAKRAPWASNPWVWVVEFVTAGDGRGGGEK